MRAVRLIGLAGGIGTLIALASCVPGPHPAPPAPPPPVRPPPHSPPPPPPPAPAPIVGPFQLDGHFVQGGLVRGLAAPGTIALTLDGRPVPLAADGRFLIGFGRDASPQALLVANGADGGRVTRTLAIAARAWDIQSLPTLPKGTAPTPDFLARRPVELARIAAARAAHADSDGWRQRFVWPAIGPISGVFGSQRIYKGEPGDPHYGVDIARGTGTPVAAPADGVVVLAADAPFTLEGNLLIIDHGMGLNSAFLHLSRIDVHEGDRVRQGQIVGAIGGTGRATGPHLHWAMKLGDVRIDPALAAGPMPAGR